MYIFRIFFCLFSEHCYYFPSADCNLKPTIAIYIQCGAEGINYNRKAENVNVRRAGK